MDTRDLELHLAEYMPAGTVVLTDYAEVLEAIRSAKMRPEPLHPTQEPLVGGSLMTLSGEEHVRRRRILNRLVRPDALEEYRERITLPTVLRRLNEIRSHPDPDGRYRTDLVTFLKRSFLEFAGEFIGLESEAIAAQGDRLEELNARLHEGFHGKWMLDGAEAHLDAAVAAKKEYKERFYDPARAGCPVPSEANAGDVATLMALLVMQADPSWQDEDTAVRESVLMLIASIETSGVVITHAVDELSRWFIEHPEDLSLATDLEFLSHVVQEALRLNPVLPHIGRLAIEDLQLTTGRVIKKGQWIAGINKLANSDEKIFGPDAKRFNPHRTPPPGVPRYGVGFGAGTHQCIGLRIVLGNTGVGSHTHVLRELYVAGVEPDPDHAPRREHSSRGHFDTYPVIFRNL